MPSILLVIARSARMLVKIAVDAGFGAVAVDCFGDIDTRQMAVAAVKVDSLGLSDLRPVVEAVAKVHCVTHIVYGSGFEAHAESLVFLEKHWAVLGNSSSVFKAFQDKREFFGKLAALSIFYPMTRFSPPVEDGRWLIKPMKSEGGVGIRRYDSRFSNMLDAGYWQSFIDGETFSLTFVARSDGIEILGFNRQWYQSLGDGRNFVFAGVANHAEVSEAHKSLVGEWLVRICDVYSLRGLGSLDFIVSEGCCYLLEINARIPASAQLYGNAVLVRHVRACLGFSDDEVYQTAEPRAYQLLYAEEKVAIPESVDWPEWATDRPDGGSIIGKGQPICSIIAAGKTPAQVAEKLRLRRKNIENRLNTGS